MRRRVGITTDFACEPKGMVWEMQFTSARDPGAMRPAIRF